MRRVARIGRDVISRRLVVPPITDLDLRSDQRSSRRRIRVLEPSRLVTVTQVILREESGPARRPARRHGKGGSKRRPPPLFVVVRQRREYMASCA